MSEVKWIKIVTDIFDDEKILLIESMPNADSIIVIWFKLLCLAGRQNNGGVFLMNGRIAYTDEMFAAIFRRPVSTVRMALNVFEQFDMIEIVNDTVTIPRWGKHQQLDALEQSREKTRKRVAAYREKQKMLAQPSKYDESVTESPEIDACNVTGNVSVTGCNADRIRIKNKSKNKSKNISEVEEEDARAREEAPDYDALCAYAANNLQSISPDAMEELLSYRDCMTDDLIRHAVNEACNHGAPRWAYVQSILRKWQANGYKTVGDVKAKEVTGNGRNRDDAVEVPRRLFAGEIVV